MYAAKKLLGVLDNAEAIMREDHEAAGEVSVEEAKQILCRFIRSHFRDTRPGEEYARFTIPADPRRDDDIRMSAFIARADRAFKEIKMLHELWRGPTGQQGQEIVLPPHPTEGMKTDA